VSDTFDLTGIDGAANYRTLTEGLKLKLLNGEHGEIIGNPGDGAWLMIRITESPDDPNRVGDEEMVYFQDVEGVFLPPESAE
jgi:hypothetical protein